ncbi:hypothetical protein HDU93_000117 [Gonapodya sp. JEL0774]|nr:hypothetical protein HDU93_000117 [Gonapodya sp. JEL0774]
MGSVSPGPLSFFIYGFIASAVSYRLFTILSSAKAVVSAPTGGDDVPQVDGSDTSDPVNERPEDVLSIESLAELVDHHNVIVQESVTQILLDRAASPETLPEVVAACCEADADLRETAVNCVALLAKIDSTKTPLVRLGALRVLCDVVRNPSERDVVRRDAVIALFKLVGGEEERRGSLVHLNLLPSLHIILSSDPSHSNDLKYWTLLLVHQLCVSDSLHHALLAGGFVPLLARNARLAFGNTNTQKLCLHAVVRLVGQVEGSGATSLADSELRKLLEIDIAAFISSCLRSGENLLKMQILELENIDLCSDDAELAYWALRLLYEFVYRDILRSRFALQRGVLPGLTRMLSTGEAPAIRVALRTAKWLSTGNEEFQRQALAAGIVRKLTDYLRSDDEETMTLALALVHTLAENVDSHSELFDSGCVRRLVELAPSLPVALALYVADVFVFLCGSSANAPGVLGDGVVATVLGFCKVLLDLSPPPKIADDTLILEIISSGGVTELQRLILSDYARRNVRQVAGKALIILTAAQCIRLIFPPENPPKVTSQREFNSIGATTPPSPSAIRDSTLRRISDTEARPGDFSSQLSKLARKPIKAFLRSRQRAQEIVPECDNLLGMLSTLSVLANTAVFDSILLETDPPTSIGVESVLGDTLADIGSSMLDLVVLPLVDKDTAHAAGISVVGFEDDDEILDEQDMTSADLGQEALFAQNVKPPNTAANPSTREVTQKKLALSTHALDVISQLLKYDGVDYVQLNCWDKTYALLVSRDHLEVRNESWTFESIRATHGVSGSGRFAFEVELRTDGIIQIGWATKDCRYDPEAGNGVGDNQESYSYDGYRKQKWHGNSTRNNAYGEAWSVGDFITCQLNLNDGTISYLQNGRFLGVAFENVDSSKLWWPAVSMAGNQQCRVNFGDKLTPFRYTSKLYRSIPTYFDPPTEGQMTFVAGNDSPISISALEVPITNGDADEHDTSDIVEPFCPIKWDLRDIVMAYEVQVALGIRTESSALKVAASGPTVKQLQDEISHLKQELDIALEFKGQNAALRDNIHVLAASADKEKAELMEKLRAAEEEIDSLRNRGSSISQAAVQKEECVDLPLPLQHDMQQTTQPDPSNRGKLEDDEAAARMMELEAQHESLRREADGYRSIIEDLRRTAEQRERTLEARLTAETSLTVQLKSRVAELESAVAIRNGGTDRVSGDVDSLPKDVPLCEDTVADESSPENLLRQEYSSSKTDECSALRQRIAELEIERDSISRGRNGLAVDPTERSAQTSGGTSKETSLTMDRNINQSTSITDNDNGPRPNRPVTVLPRQEEERSLSAKDAIALPDGVEHTESGPSPADGLQKELFPIKLSLESTNVELSVSHGQMEVQTKELMDARAELSRVSGLKERLSKLEALFGEAQEALASREAALHLSQSEVGRLTKALAAAHDLASGANTSEEEAGRAPGANTSEEEAGRALLLKNDEDEHVKLVSESKAAQEEITRFREKFNSEQAFGCANIELSTRVEEVEAKLKVAEQALRQADEAHSHETRDLISKHELMRAEKDAEIEKKNSAVSQLETALAAAKADARKIQLRFEQTKEQSEILVNSLQMQIKILQDSATELNQKRLVELEELERKFKGENLDLEKKLKAESAENEKKIRIEMESFSKKAILELEERAKRERTKVQADIDKYKRDLGALEIAKSESAKKVAMDLQSKNEELSKLQLTIKQLQSDVVAAKSDAEKRKEECNEKIKEAMASGKERQVEADAARAQLQVLIEELAGLREELSASNSKQSLLAAELDVSRQTSERVSKQVLEREDTIKKLKSKVDEISRDERIAREKAGRMEKEKDDFLAKVHELEDRILLLETHNTEVLKERDALQARWKETEDASARFREESIQMKAKLHEAEKEMKLLEKKGAQIVKDLQKQLMKERRNTGVAFHEDSLESLTGSQEPKPRTSLEVPPLPRLSGSHSSPQALRSSDDGSENDIAQLRDRLRRNEEELDRKSRVLAQYVMREHERELTTDLSKVQKSGHSFNLNILSSASAMQKQDPAILAQINLKMQKVLEDLTVKLSLKDEEIRTLETFSCSAAIVLVVLIGLVHALYDENDDVKVVGARNFQEEVFGDESVVLAEFFAPWCGHCQRLVPDYKKAGAGASPDLVMRSSLKGLVKVVAIDCNEEAHKAICGAQQIKGFPTIKVFVPRVSKKDPSSFTKSATDYEGQRSAKAMVDFAISNIPNYVIPISGSKKTAKTLPDFLSLNGTELGHVVLLSNKKDTPPLYKALANEFRNRLVFGELKDSDADDLVAKLSLNKIPGVVVWPVGQDEPLLYSGSLKHDPLAEFLGKYAKERPKRKTTGSGRSPKGKASSNPEPATATQEPQTFDPEVHEVRTQEELDATFSKTGFSVIAFIALESEYPESVVAHRETIDVLKKQKSSEGFVTEQLRSCRINAIEHGQKLMQDFGVSDMLPSLMVMNAKKKVYRLMTNAFDEAGLTAFFKDVSQQKGRFYTFGFTPLLDKPATVPASVEDRGSARSPESTTVVETFTENHPESEAQAPPATQATPEPPTPSVSDTGADEEDENIQSSSKPAPPPKEEL